MQLPSPEDRPIAKALVRLLPKGDIGVDLWRDIQVRHERRVEHLRDAVDDAAAEHGLDVEELLRRFASEERLTELLRQAVQAAAASTVDLKIRTLGRLIVSGALAEDDATLDIAELIIRVVADLEPSDFRILLNLKYERWKTTTSDELRGIPRVGQSVIETDDPAFEPVMARLLRFGLVRIEEQTDVTLVEDAAPDVSNFRSYVVTQFGVEAVRFLVESQQRPSSMQIPI